MKKFENFCSAYRNLGDIFNYTEPYGNVEMTGMIADEDLWMSALAARNNVTHAYNRAVAVDIIKETKEHFYQMFGTLKETIEKEWLE